MSRGESGGVSASTCRSRSAPHLWSILTIFSWQSMPMGVSHPVGINHHTWWPKNNKEIETCQVMRYPDGCPFSTQWVCSLWGFWSEAWTSRGHKHMCDEKQLKPKEILHPIPHHLIPLENVSGNLIRLSWSSKGNYRWLHSQMGIYTPVLGRLLALSLTYFSTNYSCYRNSSPYLNKQIMVYYCPNRIRLFKASYCHSCL